MKTRHILTAALVLLGSALLYSCDRDQWSRLSPNDYTLQAEFETNDDIDDIKHVEFYIFDDQNRLVHSAGGEPKSEIEIEQCHSKPITVVCVGYQSADQLSKFKPGTSINDLLINLTTIAMGDGQVATSPQDLFMGSRSIEANNDTENRTRPKIAIKMGRKVASMSIVTRNIQSSLNTTAIDFSYLVRGSFSSLNFAGKFSGPQVWYSPASHFTAPNGGFTAPKFYTFASSGSEKFYIDIYKSGVLLRTFTLESESNVLLLQPGRHTLVWIDYQAGSATGHISIVCKVDHWSSTLQSSEFN